MKKTIFLMAMLLTLSAAAPMASVAQQSHRNRPHTQMVDKKDKDATDEEGVVAYSDTVTADTASAANGGATFDNSLPRWIVKLFLILCVFVPMLLCFLAPIIVVLLVIRYFMRRLPEEVDTRCYRLYRLWTAAMAAVCVAVFFFVNGFQLLKLRVCGAVGGFLGDVAHAIQDRVGSLSLSLPASVSFSPSAEWTTLFHTSLMIAIALVVLGSLVLYDLDESV